MRLDESHPSKRLALWLLGVLCLVPATQTAVTVYWQIGPGFLYPLMKLVMIAAVIGGWWWMGLSRRELVNRIGWRRPRPIAAIGIGALMAAVMLGAYYLVLIDRLDPAPVLAKARALNLAEHYALFAAVIALGNAAFEEFYWRAFLVGEFRQRFSAVWTCIAGGTLFGLHHIFALAPLFPVGWTGLFVLGTMAAGAVWTLMRIRGLSIWDCYISHVGADLAILWMGYDLLVRAAV